MSSYGFNRQGFGAPASGFAPNRLGALQQATQQQQKQKQIADSNAYEQANQAAFDEGTRLHQEALARKSNAYDQANQAAWAQGQANHNAAVQAQPVNLQAATRSRMQEAIDRIAGRANPYTMSNPAIAQGYGQVADTVNRENNGNARTLATGFAAHGMLGSGQADAAQSAAQMDLADRLDTRQKQYQADLVDKNTAFEQGRDSQMLGALAQLYGTQRDLTGDAYKDKAFDYAAGQDTLHNGQWQQSFDASEKQRSIENELRQRGMDAGNASSIARLLVDGAGVALPAIGTIAGGPIGGAVGGGASAFLKWLMGKGQPGAGVMTDVPNLG